MAGKGFVESTPQDRVVLSGVEGKIPYLYDDGVYPTRKWKIGDNIVGNITGWVGHLVTKGKVVIDQSAYDTYGKGKAIPASVGDKWLDDDLDEAERAVDQGVKVPLNVYQRGALIIFTFNVGTGAFLGSGLLRQINKKNFSAVPAEFAKWVKTTIKKNGKKVKVTSEGLKKRRILETNYFFTDPKTKLATKPVPILTQPQATEIATPRATPTSPFEWAGLAIGGVTGASSFASAEGFVGIAVGVAILAAVVVGIVIIAKRQFFPH